VKKEEIWHGIHPKGILKAVLLFLIGNISYEFWKSVFGFNYSGGMMWVNSNLPLLFPFLFSVWFWIAAIIIFVIALRPQITVNP
jgi:hypothetical protein